MSSPVEGLCASCDFRHLINSDIQQVTDGSGITRDVQDVQIDATDGQQNPVVAELSAHLVEKGCDRVKTGKCEAAIFLINKAIENT